MFNNKQLNNDIESLKKEVYGPKEEKKSGSFMGFADFYFNTYYTRYTLKQRVDDLQKILKQQEKLTHLILEHLGLEYVKITEENGDKAVTEKLRPVSKKKIKEKKKLGDCECCDYAN